MQTDEMHNKSIKHSLYLLIAYLLFYLTVSNIYIIKDYIKIKEVNLVNEFVELFNAYDAATKSYFDGYILKPAIIGNLYQSILSNTEASVGVVLIQDSDLDKSTWPLPYGYHVNKLKKIMDLGADKVFIDIVFTDERSDESFKSLIDFTCNFNNPEKFYFATFDYFNNKNKYKGLRKEFEEFDNICYKIIPAKTSHPNKHTGITEHYLSMDCSVDGKCIKNGVFNILEKEPINPNDNMIKINWIDGFSNPMSEKLGCKDNLFISDTCPRHPYITVKNLNYPDNDVKSIINNNLVVYGASLEGARDLFKSPTSGNIPGAFVHSMVYENIALSDIAPLNYNENEFIKNTISSILIFIIIFTILKNRENKPYLYKLLGLLFIAPTMLLFILYLNGQSVVLYQTISYLRDFTLTAISFVGLYISFNTIINFTFNKFNLSKKL